MTRADSNVTMTDTTTETTTGSTAGGTEETGEFAEFVEIAAALLANRSAKSLRAVDRSASSGAAPQTATRDVTVRRPDPMLRSSAMLLINEDLARARMQSMRKEAEDHRRANLALAVRRSRRRAREAARRARLSRA